MAVCFVLLLATHRRVDAALFLDQNIDAEYLKALTSSLNLTRRFLTWPTKSNDPDVERLSQKARELLLAPEVRVLFTLSDVQKSLTAHELAEGNMQHWDALFEGDGRARVTVMRRAASEYVVVLDRKSVDGVGALLAGLAHEVVAHLSLSAEEEQLLVTDPVRGETILFEREVKYLMALLADAELMKILAPLDKGTRDNIQVSVDREKESLERLQGKRWDYFLAVGAVGVLVGGVLTVFKSRRRLTALEFARSKERRIRGWLLVLCISLTTLVPLMGILKVTLIPSVLGTASGLSAITEIVMIAGLIGSGVCAGVQLWTIRPGAVRTARIFLVSLLLYPAAQACIAAWQLGSRFFSRTSLTLLWTEGVLREWSLGAMSMGTVVIVAWLYLDRSRRVVATYTAASTAVKP